MPPVTVTDLLSHSTTKEIRDFQYLQGKAVCYLHITQLGSTVISRIMCKSSVQLWEYNMPAAIRSAAEPDDGAGLDAGHCISRVTSLFDDCFSGTRDMLEGKKKAEPWKNHLHCGLLMKQRRLLKKLLGLKI